MATTLETKTCSRCGGSGHYSYCQMHGTICFKCGGSGKVYTKRGAAALAYLKSIRSKPVADLVAGAVVLYEGIPGICASRWVTVTEVRRSESVQSVNGVPVDTSSLVDMLATDKSGCAYLLCGLARETPVRVAQTAEQKRDTLLRALAYQDTLTKAGTPRKRAA